VQAAKETETAGTETLTTTSSLEIILINFEVLMADGQHLFQQHCQELDNKDFEPELTRYEIIESKNSLICLGVYLGQQMVGYSTTVLFRHGHHDTLMAGSDSIYILPKFRKGIGLQLIRQTEKHAQEAGVDCIVWSAKPGSSLDLILSARRDYEHAETHYQRKLNGRY